MKIAFCLHGLSSGSNFKEGGLPVSFSKESKLFKKHLINLNDTDCFYHTWESESSKDLFNTYNPKGFKVEPIKTFVKPKIFDKLKHIYNKKVKGIDELQRLNNIFSRWYSFYESINLVLDYEKKMGVKYDFIFNTRFDMSLFHDIRFELLDKSNFYCGDWYSFYNSKNELIDEKKIFNNKEIAYKKVEGYPENNYGISDFWFCAEKETMAKFSKIYLELDKLVKIAGKSNHLIALEKIKLMEKEKTINKFLEFGKDYYLSRWIKD